MTGDVERFSLDRTAHTRTWRRFSPCAKEGVREEDVALQPLKISLLWPSLLLRCIRMGNTLNVFSQCMHCLTLLPLNSLVVVARMDSNTLSLLIFFST